MKKVGLFLVMLVVYFSMSAMDIPKFTHQYVNDYGSLLSDSEEHSLNLMLKNYQDSTSTQLVVLTLTSYDDRTDGPLFDFSKSVFSEWGIGQKAKDNGVLLVVVQNLASKNAPGLRIVTGYGTEGAIPDAVCQRIVESIRPSINEGNYYKGINSALGLMIIQLKGEFAADVKSESLPNWAMYLVAIVVFIIILLTIYLLVKSNKNDDDSEESKNNYNHDEPKRNRDSSNNSVFIASSYVSSDNSSDYSSGYSGSDSSSSYSSSSDSGCDCGGGDSGGGGGGD